MSEQTSKYAFLTTREAANRLGISLRTAQLWSEQGILEAWKTEGGHRRITQRSVDHLLMGGRKEDAPRVGDKAPAEVAQFRITLEPEIEKLRVLVVEDDNVLLKLYRLCFEHWDLPVELSTASNGYDGLILVGRTSPDMLIADLMLPGMDGFSMIRTLHGSALREGLEIVVVTGLDDTSIEAQGGLPPGIRVFKKPVPFDTLRNHVKRLIDRRRTLSGLMATL
ncbi:response regulator [Methyloterricola oryzae]|uniref:response regulator n=1 Tax=Methyloterricola oryzae TaxID=1495050 RepID=UPI0005EB2A72|nr:response regulator [Methyloterricola oryzae]